MASKMSINAGQRKATLWIPTCSVVQDCLPPSRGDSLSACLRVTQKSLCTTVNTDKTCDKLETTGNSKATEWARVATNVRTVGPSAVSVRDKSPSKRPENSRDSLSYFARTKVIQPRCVFVPRSKVASEKTNATKANSKRSEVPPRGTQYLKVPTADNVVKASPIVLNQVQPNFANENGASCNHGQQAVKQNQRIPFQFRDLQRAHIQREKMSPTVSVRERSVDLSVGAQGGKAKDEHPKISVDPRIQKGECSSGRQDGEGRVQKNSLSPGNKMPTRPRIMRSNTSTGHYPSVFAFVPQREAKSARLIRPILDSEAGSQVPQETIIRQAAAKLEDNIIHGNFQKFVSNMSHLSQEDRRRVVSHKAGADDRSSSVFFRSVQLARVTFVEHMLRECDPDLEQTGVLSITEDNALYQVTPLWLAAVSGHVDLVGLLLEAGADVNTKASSGSSVLRAACCMSRVGVVKQILAYNPQMQDGNPHGVTCLMNSVQCPELVRILVARGAKVNETDLHGNTALHHAVGDGRLETVRMLFELGASIAVTNNDGMNAIQMAAKERHGHIVEYLLRASGAKISEIIEAYEVLAAMTILEEGNFTSGTVHWHKALTLRELNKTKILKRRQSQKSVLSQIDDVSEISSVHDLASLSGDPADMAFHALLMYERVRGSAHESFLTLLMYRGAALADLNNLRQALKFWKLSYQLYQQKYLRPHSNEFDCWNTGLMRSLHFLVKLLYEARFEQQTQNVDCEFTFNDSSLIPEILARDVCRLVKDHVIQGAESAVKPVQKHSTEVVNQNLTSLLKCSLCLFAIYLDLYSSSESSEDIGHFLIEMIKENPRDCRGKTLLHLCFDSLPECLLRSEKLNGNISWPSEALVDILMLLGARAELTDVQGNSVLHAATAYHSLVKPLSSSLFRTLVKRGAHVDQTNHSGRKAVDTLREDDDVRQVLAHISLKCLSARAVTLYNIPYHGEIPVTLYSFLQLHECW